MSRYRSLIDKIKCEIIHQKVVMLYGLVTFIFLNRLNELNRTLIQRFAEKDYWNLLAYSSYKPINYFFATTILIGFGVWIIMSRYKKIRNEDLDIVDVIRLLISIFFASLLIVLLIQAISIPILKAIALVIGSIFAAAFMFRQ